MSDSLDVLFGMIMLTAAILSVHLLLFLTNKFYKLVLVAYHDYKEKGKQ